MPPKKIYRHKFTDENGVVHTVTRHIKTGDKDIGYIHADIVDELACALNDIEELTTDKLSRITARDALALLDKEG